jgi:hypothetical protein
MTKESTDVEVLDSMTKSSSSEKPTIDEEKQAVVTKKDITNVYKLSSNKKDRYWIVAVVLLLLFLLGLGLGLGLGLTRSTSSTSGQCTDDFSTLVGMDGEEAVACLETQYPEFSIGAVPEGSYVTADYRTDRIRVYVNSRGQVTTPPGIG